MDEDYYFVRQEIDRLFERKKAAARINQSTQNNNIDLSCQVLIHYPKKENIENQIQLDKHLENKDLHSENKKEEVLDLPPKKEKEIFELYEYVSVKQPNKKKFNWQELR